MFIGIDIGGTTILAGIVDEYGNIIEKRERATNVSSGYYEIENKIIDIIEELIAIGKKAGEIVEAIGIGIPGIADIYGDYVIYCANLNWNMVPLGINLKEKFNIPIFIENDATVAGLAENIIGVTKDKKNSLFITIGTGIGGGIIIDNKVYRGSHGVGSEIGHMIVGENFYPCNCGNNGCLETFASSTAVIKFARKLIEEGNEDTIILNKIHNNLENLDTKIIFDSAKLGDSLANKVVDRMVKYLSIGIVNLINIIDPEIIAIGGGVSKAGDFLLKKIKAEIPQYILNKKIGYGDIVFAELGNDAGIVGAAMLCNQR